MAKKSSKGQDSRSIIAGIIGAIVIAIAAYFGIDLSETTDDSPTPVPTVQRNVSRSGTVSEIAVERGFGAEDAFWQVYFTDPPNSNRNNPVGGIDYALAQAIDATTNSIDIAAFEWNSPRLTEAVLNAHARGVTIRMVVDDEHALEDEDSTIQQLIDVGIPVVDDERSGLMHNKFMILDNSIVWTGSTNYTVNGSYRNNNNMLMLRSRRAVETYQIEFNEMFIQHEFGSRRSEVNSARFTQDGTPIEIWFAPEDSVIFALVEHLSNAESQIRFMTFSFTLDEIGDAVLEASERGVDVSGIFEVTGSETRFSEMPRMFCSGLSVFQDGNAGILHHKVFIIDDHTVITGSFNISNNATTSNDENLVIINNPDIAAEYIAEFERRVAEARVPDGIDCD